MMLTALALVFFGGVAYMSWYKANVLDKVGFLRKTAVPIADWTDRLNLPFLRVMILRWN